MHAKLIDPYKIHPALILRTPFLSYSDYVVDKENNPLKNDYFKVALYLANPLLFDLLSAIDFNMTSLEPKMSLSILKYYNRMSFRPTPFGGFSVCSVVKWSGWDQVIVGKQENSIIKLEIDNELSLKIASKLQPGLSDGHLYYANPTLYKLRRHFRYIKSIKNQINNELSFSLESFESDTLTNALLKYIARKKLKQDNILSWVLSKTAYAEEEARAYLLLLKNAQILKTDSDPNITGEDYLKRILLFDNNKGTVLAETISHLMTEMRGIKYPTLSTLQGLHKNLDRISDHLGLKKPKTNFYANTLRPTLSGGINDQYQQKISLALEALKYLVPPVQSQTMAGFIKDFKNRFDKQKILLLNALDPDAGVGYGNLMTAFQEPVLLDQVQFTNPKQDAVSIEWSDVHRLLLKKWTELNGNPIEAIQIEPIDLINLRIDDTLLLPSSLCVVFKLIEDRIVIENAGGVSANALIGRFTALSPEILQIAKDIAGIEESNNPEVIFAEIAQLSNAHVDNINRRSAVYSYEIPVNAYSGYPINKQIALSDLYVSVVDDRIVLESSSLKKIVIPRLSSAYNHSNSELAIFRFLCDLQYQGLQANLTFNLEHFFPGMRHYPKVFFNDIVIAEAKWRLGDDFNVLRELSQDQAILQFEAIKKKCRLPDLISLAKSDQQLIFNLKNRNELLLFLKVIKEEKEVLLKEYFLPAPTSLKVVDGAGKPYTNELISFLYKESTVYTAKYIQHIPHQTKKEKAFIIGSKWLYLKIYCTPATANELLIGKVLPLLKRISKMEPVTWFFIRYNDSGYHIRLRIKISESYIGSMITQFKDSLSDTFHYHIIKEYQAETYQREIERYGADLIEKVEEFFHQSSNIILYFLGKNGPAIYSDHSLAMVSINEMLEIFIPDPANQVNFLHQMSNSFYNEFSADKLLKVSLDLKYRKMKKEFENLLSNKRFFTSLGLTKYQKSFITVLKDLNNSFKKNQDYRKNQLLADLIHMHLNRAFISHQRKQELVIYHCFYKLKMSEQARLKKVR
jgi:thiopeptide-type bacteriocin biosynthesis protein